MKFLTVTLVLAIFAGSPASVLSDEPASPLVLIRQNLWENLKDIVRIYEQQKALIKQLDVVQAMDEQASESFSNISRRFQNMGKEMPSDIRETLEMAAEIPKGVVEKFASALQDFAKRMEPATRDLYEALEPIVASRVRPALEKVRPYTTMVRTRIQEMSQNQTERLKARLGELEALGPQVKSVLRQIAEVQVALQPLADEVQSVVRENVEKAANAARPYVGPVLASAKEYIADFREPSDQADASH